MFSGPGNKIQYINKLAVMDIKNKLVVTLPPPPLLYLRLSTV